MKKILLALPLLLSVAACNGREGGDHPSLDMMAEANIPTKTVKSDARPRNIAVESAMAQLPEGAGVPKLVRERRHLNGYSQEIVLVSDDASAESRIEIAVQDGKPVVGSEKAPVWKPGEAGIRDELTHHFPDMRMQVVVNGGYENKYGSFGAAIGRKGDALRCIYAWQYVADARKTFDEGQRIRSADAVAAPAALRIKLCRADTTIDDLIAYVRALNVVIPSAYAAEEPTQAAEAVIPHRILAKRALKPRHRRFVMNSGAREPMRSPDSSTTFTYPASSDGRRFMAPIQLAPANASKPILSFNSSSLDPNLPPQAYRGPTAQPGNSR